VTRADDERVADIVEAALEIAAIVDAGEEAWESDHVRRLAVERLLEIIGESARAMTDDGRAQYPDIPWLDMTCCSDATAPASDAPLVCAQRSNSRLLDVTFAGVPDPNLPAPGKRPRSSMSPTIVFHGGRPVLAVGSPGGATIITTVLQILVEHLDRGASLPEAIATPRVSQRNSDPGDAEPAFLATPEAAELQTLGEQFRVAPATPPLPPEIGAAAGIAFLGHGRFQAAAEPVRRGGGSALVVHPLP
jgi:Gamma-glutamyltranspeptidase